MTVTMNREMTPIAYAKECKEKMKEFKTRYTDRDLLNFFQDQLDIYPAHCLDVLNVKAEATMTSFYESFFWVEIIATDFLGFARITFFMGLDGKITEDPNLWSVRLFDERQ